jgi:DNA-binding transcriptional regulator YdaS (Cro superfamily)
MRDQGLQEAIRAVGGVSELARRIGISQPSVSKWDRIPAERVISIESITGINRAILRPDLFTAHAAGDADEVNVARAQEYALLAALLARAPDIGLLERLAELRADAARLALRMPSRRRQAPRSGVSARIFQSLHRTWPRRTAALQLVLSHGISA